MKTIHICTTCLLIIIINTYSSAKKDDIFNIPIDGANEIYYNHEFPFNQPDAYSIIISDVYDNRVISSLFDTTNIETSLFSRIDTASILSIWARAGAEIGDHLLNPTGPQRDHFDNFGLIFNTPKIPLYILSRYRYYDHYSDRFNSFWTQYDNQTGKHMEYYREGLVKDITGAYLYTSSTLSIDGKIKKYGHWGAAPYLFTPLYRKGYATTHHLNLDLNAAEVDLSIKADFQDRYYDHHNKEQIIYPEIHTSWNQLIGKSYTSSIEVISKPQYSPSTEFKLSFADSTPDPMKWKLQAGIFENGKPAGKLTAGTKLLENFFYDASAEWNYYSHDKDYQFTAITDTLYYSFINYNTFTIHSSLLYTDYLLFPLLCKIWYDFADNQLWEIVDTSRNPIEIQQAIFEDKTSTIGVRIQYDLTFHPISVDVWADGHYKISGEKERLSVPWNVGIDFSWGTRSSDSLFAALSLQAVGPVTLRYKHLPNYTYEKFMTAAHTDLYMQLRIPFLSPIFRKHIKSAVWFECGPVHLDVKKRVKKHPLGNKIGPVIAVRLDASIIQ